MFYCYSIAVEDDLFILEHINEFNFTYYYDKEIWGYFICI